MDNNQLNSLFRAAKEAPVQPGFEETKAQFLQSLTTGSSPSVAKKGSIHFLKYLIMLSIISTITVGLFLFTKGEVQEVKADKQSSTVTVNEKTTNKTPLVQKTKQVESHAEKGNGVAHHQREIIDSSAIKKESFQPQTPLKPQGNEPSGMKKVKPLKSASKPDLFIPKLTDADIKENNKRKKRMVKDLIKLENKEYAYVPSGSFDYKGDPVSLQGFFISTKEVSVIQYKTFLWDLIIQGKTADFHKAKPNFEQWVNIGGKDLQHMVDHYFSDPIYDNHPINNISREGAEMYCVWLTKEANKERKEPMNDLRLPSRIEWVYATSSKGKYNTYPWGDSIVNESGCPLANFNYADYPLKDSLKCILCSNCSHNNSARSTAQFMLLEQIDYLQLTSYVNSFRPSENVLSNTSGNVAEMVYENVEAKNATDRYGVDKSRIGTAGGGWMDLPEVLQINGPDPYQGISEAHPNIGFRMVFTVL